MADLERRGKPVKPTNPVPITDMSLGTDRESVSAETVTFVGKAAAESRGINALDKRPILNLTGDRVGSYWGKNENSVWKTDGTQDNKGVVVSLTETAASADIVIKTTGSDLELLFEDASAGRFVLRAYDNTGATLSGWVGGIAASSDSYTFSIYDNTDLGTQSWIGTLADFDNTNVVSAEIYSYETSFVWGTGTVLTREVNYDEDVALKGGDIAILEGLSVNGDYAIDYEGGRIFYRRATTGASDTATYSVPAGSVANIGSITASNNIKEINGVTVVADNAASPATDYPLPVGGQYNSTLPTYTTGDRTIQQYDGSGRLIVSGGGGGGTDAEYLSPSDFTAVYTSNVTITLSGLPFTITDDSQIAFIKFIPTGGSGSDIIINGSGGATITEASGVLTVNGAGTPFAASDVYEVGINGPKKGYDLALDSLKTIEQAPVWTRYTDKETWLAAAYELTASFADVGAEIDVRGYNKLRLWVTVDIGTSTNPQIRVLEKHTSAGSEEYREIYLGSPAANITSINLNDYEVASDADQLISFVIDLDGTVPFVQLQAKDDANGDGQIDALYITKAYSA